MNKVYLALYKGKAKNRLHRFFDSVTKFFTKGAYSHCEIAIFDGNSYMCYSSSIRDGGVRKKVIDVNNDNWDLLELDIHEKQVVDYFNRTKGSKYDLLGALGVVLGLREHNQKYFCSEWCFNAIFQNGNGWRFSPSDLASFHKEGLI